VVTDVTYRPRNPEESLLYQVVAGELETFLASQEAQDQTIPKFVEDEFRSFLECGILAHGFVRLRCESCGHSRLVPFSCRRRGWCPSCGGRRMAGTAAHLVDHVIPVVPVRQWVLSVPFALRYRLAYDSSLLSDVLNALLKRRALGPDSDPGAEEALSRDEPGLAAIYSASVRSTIASGPKTGRRVVTSGDQIDGSSLDSLQSVPAAFSGDPGFAFWGYNAESFSTERPSLSTVPAVNGQIEVTRCSTARTWVPGKAGRG